MDDNRLSLIWFAENIERIKSLCNRVNYAWSDELFDMCLDVTPEIFNRFDERGPPLDRYMLSVLRRRCIARCVRIRRQIERNGCEIQITNSIAADESTALTLEAREFLLSILRGLGLTDSELQVFWLYTVDNLTFKQIAERICLSEPSTRRLYWSVFWRVRKLSDDYVQR